MYDGDINTSPQAEVRMIDFAQCVLKGEENNTHVGPDAGYMKGLRNLIAIFKNIRNSMDNTTVSIVDEMPCS